MYRLIAVSGTVTRFSEVRPELLHYLKLLYILIIYLDFIYTQTYIYMYIYLYIKFSRYIHIRIYLDSF
jgi:hypothetical protein